MAKILKMKRYEGEWIDKQQLKKEAFFEEAKAILKNHMDHIEADELYHSAKLIQSIHYEFYDYYDRYLTLPVAAKYEDDCGDECWEEVHYNITSEKPYFLCVEFTDGSYLPIPTLAARDWEGKIEERCGVFQEILKLGLRYCRQLRRAAIEAKLKFYKKSTLITDS